MKRVLGILVLLIFSSIFVFTQSIASHEVTPKNIKTSIYLQSMEAVKVSEKQDDLYINMTAYPSEGKNYDYNIPTQPLHWISHEVNQIKKLKLWEGTLKPGQSITLLLSLVEQDLPPWNTDDLIGNVRIRLKNEKGHLVSDWSLPNNTHKIPTARTKEGVIQKISLSNGVASYMNHFILTQEATQDASDDISSGAKKYGVGGI